jgi:FkbM family methyltransferase
MAGWGRLARRAWRRAKGEAPSPDIEPRLARIERRLEEMHAYLGVRAHPMHASRSLYLGDHTAIGLLHGRHLIYLDTRGTDIVPHIAMHGVWETEYVELFRRLIRPGDLVLDLGANHGVYTLVAAEAAGPTGQVHAFEPNPRLAELLGRSLLVNGFGAMARVHPHAVGEAEGTARLIFDWAWSGGGHLTPYAGPDPLGRNDIPCRVAALDEVFPDPATRLGVVKMDVEGTEGRALRGMRGLLARSPEARLMLEFAPAMMTAQGVGPAVVVEELAGLGFRFWSIEGGAPRPIAAEALATTGAAVQNILACRRDPVLVG